MSDQLRQCPEDFYYNCQNAGIKCASCGAGLGNENSKVHYKPIDENLDDHPYNEILRLHKHQRQRNKRSAILVKKNTQRSKEVKKALRMEDAIAKKIASTTLRSGALNGDGDIKILDGYVRADVKTRYRTKNFTVTWEEYKKGQQQGISHWIITVFDDQGKAHSLVCVLQDVYCDLLKLANGANDLKHSQE